MKAKSSWNLIVSHKIPRRYQLISMRLNEVELECKLR